MKKIKLIFGLVLVAGVLISFTAEQKHRKEMKIANASLFNDVTNPFEEVLKDQANEVILVSSIDLNVIEIEEDIDLGIDTSEYLPYGFDAYKGYQIDIADICVLEIEEEVELGFDVNDYLPANFDPYKV
ncbi:hypothetical protein SAMN04488008_102127 [Maribacter orientalis]|uniref:Uncharacterized protein n=1 Tax=Maribacter orientalis TaxID=228957 RepID=A0A1H7JRC5_9FLAO|nr:hypothetical protein [Maribacter orientalis]SEK76944.1 hypothetical protein SAMN04488008_102127 [Maribacter orientalis]|tara:strand:- start:197 stop:583 length:387 start_codon:yes stop_codon:yes gene_type:complete